MFFRYLKLVLLIVAGFFVLLVVYFISLFFINESRIGDVQSENIIFQAQCGSSQLSVINRYLRGGFDAPAQNKYYLNFSSSAENKEAELFKEDTFSIFNDTKEVYFITQPNFKDTQSVFYTGMKNRYINQLSVSSDVFSEAEFTQIRDCIVENFETFQSSYGQVDVIAHGRDVGHIPLGYKFVCADNSRLEFDKSFNVDYVALISENPYSFTPIGYFDHESTLHKMDYDYVNAEVESIVNRYPAQSDNLKTMVDKIQHYSEVESSVPELLSACKDSSGKTVLDYYTFNN